ncbi:MAG: formylglycine-generating enzyme family protein, partial [Planctomycetaceae bacterium]|nr:formylglycine-generating enzyme family protein [Planctomycetaceae bacterium]
EWEYACRAGTVTARYYGETDTLLDRYAWYANNSRTQLMLPIGSLKPNDLGLFDMLGNVFEWPQEAMSNHEPGDDLEDQRVVTNKLNRALRGGSFFYLSLVVRSAYRIGYQPSFQSFNFGFRVARTRNEP